MVHVDDGTTGRRALRIGAVAAFADFGGAPRSTLAILRSLQARGHDITLCCRQSWLAKQGRQSGFAFVELPRSNFQPDSINELTWRNARTIVGMCRSGCFDVVFAFSSTLNPLLLLGRVFGRTPMAIHHLGHIVTPVNTPSFDGAVITISEEARERLMRFYGRSAERIDIIRNRVAIADLLDADPPPLPEASGPVILILSRFGGHKNQIVLRTMRAAALAAKRMPGLVLRVAGAGTDRAEIDDTARRINTEAGRPLVDLVGYLFEVTSVKRHINAADVVVGVGRSMWESMVLGKPAIVSGPLGLDEIVDEQTVGSLARCNFAGRNVTVPQSDQRLADALIKVLTDTEYRRKLVAFGTAYAREHFDVRQAGEKFEPILLRQASTPPPPWPTRCRMLFDAAAVIAFSYLRAVFKLVVMGRREIGGFPRS